MTKRCSGLCWTVAAGVVFFCGAAEANMSYSPWIHSLIQDGQDVEITLNIFEDSTQENVYSGADEATPFPDFEDVYSLSRFGVSSKVLFEDRQFAVEDAVEEIAYGCQGIADESEYPDDYCLENSDACVDCDDDGEPECPTFCAAAYRFVVTDTCVPPGEMFYLLNTPEIEAVPGYGEEGLGMQSIVVTDSGAECQDSDSDSCSVVAPAYRSSTFNLTALLRAIF